MSEHKESEYVWNGDRWHRVPEDLFEGFEEVVDD